ncbi:unnamed protein product [Bursaphelenchus okinawaensis]|uniref:Uncharacterized protein n=1 Tax=Bursaphelenchus okinawaensis TaxID=465554 RepID=A0A811KQY4_9BILA|nr:unnamed protein product [Bursaphelenchus okinawaensis]CAG9112112.1 unnamed protein product [Bursaphelenchus okinawaensis]
MSPQRHQEKPNGDEGQDLARPGEDGLEGHGLLGQDEAGADHDGDVLLGQEEEFGHRVMAAHLPELQLEETRQRTC